MSERCGSRVERPVHFAWLLACLCLSATVAANEVKVTVLDSKGEAVADVAVYAQFADPGELPAPADYAVMDQVDTRFDPHILIVQSGTEVRFPNSDVVAHHVYSFSNPNDFMLPLYKGDAHAPVTFDESGIVTLGCNIHDQMLGYILVIDSNIFTKTDENGVAILSVGSVPLHAVTIWSPRINTKGETLSKPLSPEVGNELIFNLAGKLRPPHASESGALKWSDY
jgi:plastocyanin